MARENVTQRRFEGKIAIKQENVLNLSFDDESFDYILCWGVLMHIPDIDKAISELARVLKPGGVLILNENNMHSLQSIMTRALHGFSGRKKTIMIKRTAAGVEHIPVDSSTMVFTREANVDWLVSTCKKNHLHLMKRFSGEFTDAYIKVPSSLGKRLIHRFNNLWFRYLKIPTLAEGNILFFQKRKNR